MKILIVGCGYVGTALAQECSRTGHEICGVVRTEASQQSLRSLGIQSIAADLSASEEIFKISDRSWDVVVISVSSKGGDYRKTYLDVTRNVLDGVRSHPPKLILFTGSTSVYAQNNGEIVHESSSTQPHHPNARILLETEDLLRNWKDGGSAVVLRISGIYGPSRHHWLDRLRLSPKEIEGDPNRWMNQIHRDDVVAAIRFCIEHWDQWRGFQCFNVSDNTPALFGEMIEWFCTQLGASIPQYGGMKVRGSRGDNNRRISNDLLCKSGWEPVYKDYREGFSEILKA